MLIKPFQRLDIFLLQAIGPKAQLVGLHRMDAELAALATFDPLGPHITIDRVGEQAELIGHSFLRLHLDRFGAIAIFDQSDGVFAWGDFGIDGAARGRAYYRNALPILLKIDAHIIQGDIAFISHITNKHFRLLRYG